jgi:hypothetical protein
MCEFLVYKKSHWMDALDQAEVDRRIAEDPRFEQKYNSRYQPGDYIEIREDGYWSDPETGKGYHKDAFELVMRPGVPVETLKHLVEPHYEILNEGRENEQRNILKRRKYKIDTSIVSSKEVVDGRTKITLSTEKEFEDLSYDKAEEKTLTDIKPMELSK